MTNTRHLKKTKENIRIKHYVEFKLVLCCL